MLAAIEAPQIANIDAEAALCGSLMQSAARNIIDQIADRVRGEDFAEPLHGRIFDAILSLHGQGKSPNPVTLKPYFEHDEAIAEVGGVSYLVKIMSSSGVEVIFAKDFADQIRELAQRRRLIEGLREAGEQARRSDIPLADAALTAEEAISEATETEEGSGWSSASEAIAKLVDGIHQNDPGIHSGITALDATLGPIRKHNLVILAGRPGMGKSAVASSYALGAAARGHGTLFVSREMSEEELAERMAADLCFDSPAQVPYAAITNRHITSEQGREMARAADRISNLPLVIEDKRGRTLASLNTLVRNHGRRFAAKGKKLELLIVDYLQLVSPDTREKDLYTRVSEVSKGLKDLAKVHGIGVLAVCQLSRAVEQRADKRPIMADLRDSGQIEQDADAICLLFAPEYYLLQCEPRAGEDRSGWEHACAEAAGEIEFIVPKRRRGPGGVGRGHFYRAFQAVR